MSYLFKRHVNENACTSYIHRETENSARSLHCLSA